MKIPFDTCTKCNRNNFSGTCTFVNAHLQKLRTLDFEKTLEKLEKVVKHFNCKDVCFVVYEKPEVKCGERLAIRTWFKENGKEVLEFVEHFRKTNVTKFPS